MLWRMKLHLIIHKRHAANHSSTKTPNLSLYAKQFLREKEILHFSEAMKKGWLYIINEYWCGWCIGVIIISIINDDDLRGKFCCTLYFTSWCDSESAFDRIEDMFKDLLTICYLKWEIYFLFILHHLGILKNVLYTQ